MSSPVGGTGVGSSQVSELARALHRMGPAGRRAMRKRMVDLAAPLLADARARASWSTRIPGALSVKPILRDDRIGLQLRASVKSAPHARAYEGLVQPDSFRHPLFGDRDGEWYVQATRPYAAPAVAAKADDARRALGDAYEDAAREVGFR